MIDPREELKAYLDGELTAQEAGQVREALQNDPLLAAQADQMRAISATLAHESVIQPVGLERTLAAIRTRKPWWRQPAIAWPAAISVAGAMAMAVFLTVVLMPSGSGSNLYAAKFIPRRESDSALPEMAAKSAAPAPQASAKARILQQFSNQDSASEPQDQAPGKTDLKSSFGSADVRSPERRKQPLSVIAVELQGPAEANSLLTELSKKSEIVSIERSPKTLRNELSVTVVYTGAPDAAQESVMRSLASRKDARAFAAPSFRLRITLRPAKQ